jgi:hypothetical protein
LLAGRVPANVVALVMKAEPGAELACRARNYHFEHAESPQERGVISYYAGQTLAQATTFAAWLQRIEALSSADFQGGHLPWFYQPSLQLLGHAASRLPGEPVKAAVEQR